MAESSIAVAVSSAEDALLELEQFCEGHCLAAGDGDVDPRMWVAARMVERVRAAFDVVQLEVSAAGGRGGTPQV